MTTVIPSPRTVADHDVPADRERRSPGSGVRTALAVAAAITLGGALAVSPRITLPAAAHDAVLLVHLAALVLGFGAVLAVDWHGALWLLRRLSLEDLLAVTARLTSAIWVGLGVLVATGALLSPDLASPAARVKLALVAVAGANGVHASSVHAALSRAACHGGAVPTRLLVRGLATGGVSQVAWWGATVIGFLTAH